MKNSAQTHCPYSPDCLRDTLLMKRNSSLPAGGWFRELYDFSVRRAGKPSCALNRPPMRLGAI